MPGDKKNLRNAEAGADPVVDFNYNELLAELEKEITPQLDETCEVCAPMLIAKGMSQERAYRTLNNKQAAGELVSRYAIYKGQRVKAYRKS